MGTDGGGNREMRGRRREGEVEEVEGGEGWKVKWKREEEQETEEDEKEEQESGGGGGGGQVVNENVKRGLVKYPPAPPDR